MTITISTTILAMKKCIGWMLRVFISFLTSYFYFYFFIFLKSNLWLDKKKKNKKVRNIIWFCISKSIVDNNVAKKMMAKHEISDKCHWYIPLCIHNFPFLKEVTKMCWKKKEKKRKLKEIFWSNFKEQY